MDMTNLTGVFLQLFVANAQNIWLLATTFLQRGRLLCFLSVVAYITHSLKSPFEQSDKDTKYNHAVDACS
jgi:hypothetical protein